MKAFYLTLIIVFISTTSHVSAIGVLNDFGGRISFIIPCTCQVTGIAVYVLSPKPPFVNMLLWQPPLTRPSKNYFPTPGAKIIGKYSVGAACFVGVPPACVPIPVVGLILRMGTSVY